MRQTEGVFDAGGGVRLYWQRWCPDAPALAVLIITHGFGEHSRRYQKIAARAIHDGIAVYAWDHRGHGKSPGKRGHIDSISDYRNDIDLFIELVVGMESNRPLFLWGHSMGSLVALDRVIRKPQPLRSVLASSAGFEPAGVATRSLVKTARLMSKLWPGCPLTVPVEPAQLMRDADAVAEYEADPLVHNKATARWMVSLLEEIQWLKSHAHEIRLPILMMHGEADTIHLPIGSKRFFANVAHPDKRLKLYPDALHEVHFDLDRDAMIADMLDWILAHSRKPR